MGPLPESLRWGPSVELKATNTASLSNYLALGAGLGSEHWNYKWPTFYVGSGALNSGPQIYMAGSLAAESPP